MAYWRMQLHPDDIAHGATRAGESLARGLIGLDFRRDVGDLRGSHDDIEKGQRPYLLFASEMRLGDLVLVQVGSRPFAFVEVSGDYDYVPDPRVSHGVWFRHMRPVKNVRLYSDFVPQASARERIPFRSTLMAIRRKDQPAYRLIERWANAP